MNARKVRPDYEVYSVLCTLANSIYVIRTRQGKTLDESTVAMCFTEDAARSVTNALRVHYGLDPDVIEQGDFRLSLTPVNRLSKKELATIKPTNDDWDAARARILAAMPGMTTATRKPNKKLLTKLDKEIRSSPCTD